MAVETVLLTQARGGGEPVQEFPAEIIRYGQRLNRPGSIEFTLALDHPKTVRTYLAEGVHEAVVRRNGLVVWAGPIRTVQEVDQQTGRQLHVRGEGLLSYLRSWHVTTTLAYTGVDQLTIARGLIDHHQVKAGGAVGIDTSGGEASGVLRTRTYHAFELKNIWDALVELSEVEHGFDFAVDPSTRRFVPYYPRRGRRRDDIVFDARNIRSFQRSRDATAQASQIWAVGEGEGDDMLRVSRQSSSAVALHGLTQSVIAHKDVSVLSTLEGHADSTLARTASVPNRLTLTASTYDPTFGSYEPGDEVRVVWESPYDPVDEFQRLVGIDVTWAAGEEQVDLHLEPI